MLRFSPEAEVFVIDNGSNDDTLNFLKINFPEVKTVVLPENLGFAGGYNEGLKHINAEIYCLLNSDVEVTENWIPPVLKIFDQDKKVAAVQPKILSFNQKNMFEFAGAGGGFIDNLGYPYCRGRVFDSLEEDHGQYDDETEIFWASGCAMFVKSKDFWSQNGLDERFFAHQEEIDLCWRLKNDGKKIMYTGFSTVYHVGGGTLNKQNPQKTYLNFRNNLSMLLKNLPFPKLLYLIFFRLILDGVAGIVFGLKNGFQHLWAVVRAHFAFYTQAAETWKRRGTHQIKHFYSEKWMVFRHFL